MTARPEPGPRPLFFSGGTALGPVSSALARLTPRAAHVITTFDSGGSSAVLRRAFAMPAVGDVRARLIALADAQRPGSAQMLKLFSCRLPGTPQPLPSDAPTAGEKTKRRALQRELRCVLESLVRGEHALIRDLPEPARIWTRERLSAFASSMPEDLDLAGASLGNLVLAAEYLAAGRRLDTAARAFAGLLGARGDVFPIVETSAHLCVRLVNGERIIGQHRFTGKSVSRITSPIADVWLSASLEDPGPIAVRIAATLDRVIRSADLICYPVGSFFSSVLANLLPQGVSEAVRAAPCPKLFIPNLGSDPELFGLTIRDQVSFLLGRLLPPREAGNDPEPEETKNVLNALLIDEDERRYPGGIPHTWLHRLGIRTIRAALVTPSSAPYLDPERVCARLMALM